MHLYFSDESADPGVTLGASPVFAVCLVRTDAEGARATRMALGQLRVRLGLPSDFEFRCSRNHPRVREAALNAIAGQDVEFRVRFWQKPVPVPRLHPANFGEVDLLRACLRDFGPNAAPGRLFLDGGRDRSRVARIRKGLGDLKDAEGNPRIREVRLQDSRDSDLLQVADLLAGMVVRIHLGREDARRLLSLAASLGKWRAWP